ncbi:MAG: amidohydrolase family protein [Clostridia bacterium]|nr:amidohydrolase family protein [Clostridia bacterium]
MIFDIHTHAFPKKIAGAATGQLSYRSGGLEPFTDGTFEGLCDFMASQSVYGFALQNIATNPNQMKKVNDFAASCARKNVFPFGSVHPDAPDALSELERIKELGMKGIKLHPDYQGFFVDEERMFPIYKKASELGLCILFHAGYDFGFSAPYHCMPENLARALSHIDTQVIAAHWGGLSSGAEVIKHLCGLPLYFDTSFGYGTRPRSEALEIIERHGTDKLVFGSDCPWHSPEMELKLLATLELSQNELADITCNNAKKLLEF